MPVLSDSSFLVAFAAVLTSVLVLRRSVFATLCFCLSPVAAAKMALIFANSNYTYKEQLSDLNMPDKDALTVARHLKQFGFEVSSTILACDD